MIERFIFFYGFFPILNLPSKRLIPIFIYNPPPLEPPLRIDQFENQEILPLLTK